MPNIRRVVPICLPRSRDGREGRKAKFVTNINSSAYAFNLWPLISIILIDLFVLMSIFGDERWQASVITSTLTDISDVCNISSFIKSVSSTEYIPYLNKTMIMDVMNRFEYVIMLANANASPYDLITNGTDTIGTVCGGDIKDGDNFIVSNYDDVTDYVFSANHGLPTCAWNNERSLSEDVCSDTLLDNLHTGVVDNSFGASGNFVFGYVATVCDTDDESGRYACLSPQLYNRDYLSCTPGDAFRVTGLFRHTVGFGGPSLAYYSMKICTLSHPDSTLCDVFASFNPTYDMSNICTMIEYLPAQLKQFRTTPDPEPIFKDGPRKTHLDTVENELLNMAYVSDDGLRISVSHMENYMALRYDEFHSIYIDNFKFCDRYHPYAVFSILVLPQFDPCLDGLSALAYPIFLDAVRFDQDILRLNSKSSDVRIRSDIFGEGELQFDVHFLGELILYQTLVIQLSLL